MTNKDRCLVAAGLVGLTFVTGACDAGSVAGSSIPLEEIDGELHAASCRARVRCGSMPDVATCLVVTDSPIPPDVAAHLASKKIVYDPAKGRALVDMWDAVTCSRSDNETGRALLDTIGAWRAAFHGTVAPGGACFIDDDCAVAGCEQDDHCWQACCEGRCAAPLPVAARDEPCGPALAECETDSVCALADPLTGTRRCVALAALGEECEPGFLSFSCAPGTTCDTGTASGTPRCQKRPATDEPCTPGGVYCDDRRDYCDPTTKVCQRQVPAGSACAFNGPVCASGNRCDPTTHTCGAPGLEGDRCDPTDIFTVRCLGDLTCDATTSLCVRPPPQSTCPR